MEYTEIAERVRLAFESRTPLSIVGGKSKSFLGRESAGEPLPVDQCRGVVDYDPSELVLTVRCGTPLEQVEALLAEQGQFLPFEAPQFSGQTSMGGVTASGLSGPRRPWSGSVRDFVLGVVCVSGRGEILRFGGRVMKNVAGFDVSRLMVGALGTLGVVLETSFKVLPAPESEVTRMLDFDEGEAGEFMARISRTPLPVSASCFFENRLYVRLSGSEAGIAAAGRVIGGESLEDDGAFWRSLRNQTHPFFGDEEEIWRVSVAPATTALQAPGGATLIEWGGALRWVRGHRAADVLADEVAFHGGNMYRYRGGDRCSEVFPIPDAVTGRFFKRLKDTFDPARILNPGRLYRDL
jgi:glycolate oxidase FAD binding subunit